MKAMAQAVPDQVIAGGNDCTHALAISHLGPEGLSASTWRSTAAALAADRGTTAAMPSTAPLSNCTNTPVEATDMDFDISASSATGCCPTRAGRAQRRGGAGLFRRFLILKDGTNFAIYTDRVRLAPYGLFGGGDGSRTRIEIERDGQVIKLKSKDRVDLEAGDILTLYSSGGGGYGPAAERDPRLVADDVDARLRQPDRCGSALWMDRST